MAATLRWCHGAEGELGGLHRVLRLELDGKGVVDNLQGFAAAATAVGLVPKAAGNVLVVDTTVLPEEQVKLAHVGRTISVYREAYPLLKQFVHTTVLVVNNSTVRMLVDSVVAVMPRTATKVVTVATPQAAEVAVRECLTTWSPPRSCPTPAPPPAAACPR